MAMVGDSGAEKPQLVGDVPPVPLLNCVRIRICIRVKQHSPQTEPPYLDWIKRFIHFHGKRHPPGVRAHLQPPNPIFIDRLWPTDADL